MSESKSVVVVNSSVSELARINDMNELYHAVTRSGMPFKKTLKAVLLAQGLDKKAAREMADSVIASKAQETNSLYMAHVSNRIQQGWRFDYGKPNKAGTIETMKLVAPPKAKVSKSSKIDVESIKEQARREFLESLLADGQISHDTYFNVVSNSAYKAA